LVSALPRRRAFLLFAFASAFGAACGQTLDTTTAPGPDGGSPNDPSQDSGTLIPSNPDGGADAAGDGKERIDEISPGGGFSCARTTRGRVFCWGINAREALAPEFSAESVAGCKLDMNLTTIHTRCVSPPIQIKTLENVTKVAVGRFTACALRSDRFVSCWGSNEVSNLGMGTVDDKNHGLPGPIAVDNVLDISVGFHASCALRKGADTNEVWCWGSRDLGLIGTSPRLVQPPANSSIDPAIPSRHPELDGAKAVKVSHDYPNACAINSLDQVVCWGRNHNGTLGHNEGLGNDLDCFFGFGGPAQKCKASPSIVSPDTKVSAIELGPGFGCAIVKDDRRLVCWGENRFATLGQGTSDGNQNPVFRDVLGPGGVKLHAKSLSATWRHVCAMTDELGVTCWGTNNAFQMGPSMASPGNCEGIECVGARALPFQQNIDKVIAGWDVTYLRNGVDKSWTAIGANDWALLGHFPNVAPDVKCGTAACSPTPALVPFPF